MKWTEDDAVLCLILREDLGWDNARIAEFLGTTLASVKCRNSRTRRNPPEKRQPKWKSTPHRAKIEFDETGLATIG